jgi:hypothetical protein
VSRIEGLSGFRATAKRVAELAGVPCEDGEWTPAQKRAWAKEKRETELLTVEADEWYRCLRRRLVRLEMAVYAWERRGMAYPDNDWAWLVFRLADLAERDLRREIDILDASTAADRLAAYRAIRTPELAEQMRARVMDAERLAVAVVALLSHDKSKSAVR